MSAYTTSLLVAVELLACLVGFSFAQQPLGKYNVDTSKISVSGFSSGAVMATQMHVAYSGVFMGAGLVAGNPYYCAQGSYAIAFTDCMTEPEDIDVSALIAQTDQYASSGDIDPTSNMADDRVFILGGTLDTVIVQGEGMKAQQYYENYMSSGNIMTNFEIAAEHTFPTEDYGNACDYLGVPYIGRCSYNGAYEIMNHTYGDLQRPPSGQATPGDFYLFDQREFFYVSSPNVSSMDDSGYVYVPSACIDGSTQCRLHVAFHGCSQGKEFLGDEYALNTGYSEVGELNNIIILYPQIIATAMNLFGCWDGWGYTVDFYATKNANQPLACWRMVERIAY